MIILLGTYKANFAFIFIIYQTWLNTLSRIYIFGEAVVSAVSIFFSIVVFDSSSIITTKNNAPSPLLVMSDH
jgi:hypothetical protein